MKALHPSSQFKEDVKRIRNNPLKLARLREVLDVLASEIGLPERCMAHRLVGGYKDCLECHIEGDLLLVWLARHTSP